MRNNLVVISFIILFSNGCNLFTTEESDIPGKFVFSIPDKNGNYQIYTSLANGANRQQLTYFKNESSNSPSWSPDGKQIVFTSSLNGTFHESPIYIMDSNGSNLRPMHQPKGTQRFTGGDNPRWSPDGSKIAFSQCNNCAYGGNSDIYIFDFETEKITQITDHPADERFPSWNPNKPQIAFVSDREYYQGDSERFRTNLYLSDVNGDNVIQVNESSSAGYGIWSKTQGKIYYKTNNNDDLNFYDLGLEEHGMIAVELPINTGFRAINISDKSEYIFLATFNTKFTGHGTSIQVYYAIDNTVTTLMHEDKLLGMDWYSN